MKAAADEDEDEILVPEQADLPAVTSIEPAAAESIWNEIEAAAIDENHNHTFILAWGAEGTMKTGCVMDALTEQDLKDGGCILTVDFDRGAAACRSAHHRDKLHHIRCLPPWAMSGEGRTTYNYPETHDRTLDIGRTAIEWARRQQNPDYKGARLTWFVVTGIDLWDEVATNCMKIVDLDAAPDGIAAKVNAASLVGNRWNWQIRHTRFHQLTAIGESLMSLGIKVYFETHEQVIFKDNVETNRKKPKCESGLVFKVRQIIHYTTEEERDDSGNKTGVVNYWATFTKSATNLDLQGQRRLVGVTRPNEPGVFHGLPELAEGNV